MATTISTALVSKGPELKKSPVAAKTSSAAVVADQFVGGQTPAEFGQMHRAKLQSVLDPLAQSVGAKSYNSKLSDAVLDKKRTDTDTAMLYDNLAQAQEVRKGSIPLKELYEIDQQLAEQAAAQAAKTSNGILTPESARFLPQAFLADYQAITGQQTADMPGVAVDGVSVKQDGANTSVAIDFEKALAGATAKGVVLALTDSISINASRLEGVQDPEIPPYWITISPREGKVPYGTQAHAPTGYSGFSNPDNGHLIFAGTTTIELSEDRTDKPFQTLTFDLDKVNSYGVPEKPASNASKASREAWEARFSEENGGFDFADGVASGALEARQLSDVRDQPGIKVLFSAIRETTGQSISKLFKDGLLEFAFDKQSNSLGVLRRLEESVEQRLSIVDTAKGKWVGSWVLNDDGSKDWSER